MLTTNHVPTLTLTLTLLLPYVASGRGLSRTRTLTVALIIVLPFLACDRATEGKRDDERFARFLVTDPSPAPFS